MLQQILKTKQGKWAVAMLIIAGGGIIGCANGNTWGALPVVLLFVVVAAILVLNAIKYIKNPPPAPTLSDQGIYISNEALDQFYAYGTLPHIDNSPVILSQGENAVYACRADRVETKNRRIGTTGGGAGASFRVAKGVSIRTGGTGSKAVYGDVEMIHSGEFVITTDRIVFISNNRAFEEKLEKVSAVAVEGGALAIMTAKENYSLRVPMPEHPCEIIKACIKSL